ncbi:hypothetical protein MCRY_15705 [Marivita cryptomonadis]|nr:hypothetical protein MCRY_15705 [Marivita cryptomonadis]
MAVLLFRPQGHPVYTSRNQGCTPPTRDTRKTIRLVTVHNERETPGDLTGYGRCTHHGAEPMIAKSASISRYAQNASTRLATLPSHKHMLTAGICR